jgi:hypothetical protein
MQLIVGVDMNDQGAGIEAAKANGDPLGTVAGLLARFVPEGPAPTAVLLIEGLCVAVRSGAGSGAGRLA